LAAIAAVVLISGELCRHGEGVSWRGWTGWWVLAPAAGVFAAGVATRALHAHRRAVAVGAGILTALVVTAALWIAGWGAGFGSCVEALR
jgi:hypothetical protein